MDPGIVGSMLVDGDGGGERCEGAGRMLTKPRGGAPGCGTQCPED